MKTSKVSNIIYLTRIDSSFDESVEALYSIAITNALISVWIAFNMMNLPIDYEVYSAMYGAVKM